MMHRPLPRTLPACLRDVRSAKATVRRSAVQELCRFLDDEAPEEVVAAMMEALEDEDPEVRTHAAYCLGDAGVVKALPRLLVAVDDPAQPVRQAALDALGRLGDERATARLERAVRDERADVRFQAIVALARVMPQSGAMAALRALSDQDRHVRYIAVRTIEELAQSGLEDPETPLELEDEVVAGLKSLLEDDVGTVRLAAAILLARSGRLDGAAVLVEAVENKIAGMEPEDELEAVSLAGKMGVREAIEGLRKRAFGLGRLVTEKHAWAARVALARLGDQKAVRSIEKDLGSWSRRKRTLAVVAAGHAALLHTEQTLRAMVGRSDMVDQQVLAEALESLEQAGNKEDR